MTTDEFWADAQRRADELLRLRLDGHPDVAAEDALLLEMSSAFKSGCSGTPAEARALAAAYRLIRASNWRRPRSQNP